ncbi:hypothetical protein DPMN_049046 [Dreissena polymorpha]|uniref:Uncharacterized protein n=1 Tax=Dreissena polymorpha TaxID=45954 RepID=A0A9D4DBU7_DREPO|nr:hypothetical protein DPMN_049046 [Dreissena polymorpha]
MRTANENHSNLSRSQFRNSSYMLKLEKACMYLKEINDRLYSDKEPFLASLRILGGTYSSIVGKVCAASVPVSEFHTLLKIGDSALQ